MNKEFKITKVIVDDKKEKDCYKNNNENKIPNKNTYADNHDALSLTGSKLSTLITENLTEFFKSTSYS